MENFSCRSPQPQSRFTGVGIMRQQNSFEIKPDKANNDNIDNYDNNDRDDNDDK